MIGNLLGGARFAGVQFFDLRRVDVEAEDAEPGAGERPRQPQPDDADDSGFVPDAR